jgi:hypothetical protein
MRLLGDSRPVLDEESRLAVRPVGKPPTLGYYRRWLRKATSMHLAGSPRQRGSVIWTVLISVVATLLVVFFALNLTTGEKRVKEQLVHRYGIHDAQFQRTMGVLLGPVILPGNRFATLLNGDEIFPSMLQAIKGAQRTITFETYIYWSGDAAFAAHQVEVFERDLNHRGVSASMNGAIGRWPKSSGSTRRRCSDRRSRYRSLSTHRATVGE